MVSSTILSYDQCREEHVCCCGRYSSANACRVLSDEGGNSMALHWYRHKSNLRHVWDREIIQKTMKDYYDRMHGKDFSKQLAGIGADEILANNFGDDFEAIINSLLWLIYDMVSSTILSCDQCHEEHVCCYGRYSSAYACRVLSDEGGNSIALRWYRHKSNLHHVWDREIIQQTMKDYYDRTHGKDFGKQFAGMCCRYYFIFAYTEYIWSDDYDLVG
ncbi:hypothetical protein DVH24_041362 [Malus domestica]|uniref:Aspergillus nuclease S1 n=1 Tax=Malus domestica TaxID=3750 RepID=A0A498IDQ3_MALDO|nr:hypothetical protein DVH24_041362 [Malus domestica]